MSFGYEPETATSLTMEQPTRRADLASWTELSLMESTTSVKVSTRGGIIYGDNEHIGSPISSLSQGCRPLDDDRFGGRLDETVDYPPRFGEVR